jgi:ribosomal protein S12 methylthiotransferase accessory factor
MNAPSADSGRIARGLAPPADSVGAALRRSPSRAPADERDLLKGLIRRRAEFGVSRLADVTGLDHSGIPVVQAVRPLSLSNAVSQGKGQTRQHAAIAALMESLELWAGEQTAAWRMTSRSGAELADAVRSGYCASVHPGDREAFLTKEWIIVEGYDILTDCIVGVPAGAVDTAFLVEPPWAAPLPRSTTGLGAGPELRAAIRHAALELLERDAVARCGGISALPPGSRLDPACAGPRSSALVARLAGRGFLVGAWRVPAPHPLPVVWCHVMEPADLGEHAPLPGEGFACGLTLDTAVERALLEAAQSRTTAIVGAHEDITRRFYATPDRGLIEAWREHLRSAPPLHAGPPDPWAVGQDPLQPIIDALVRAGAATVVAVPLFLDPENGLAAVRLVAPHLRAGRGHGW